MKWDISWRERYLKDQYMMGDEQVEANAYIVSNRIGLFFDDNGNVLHSVPADKVIVKQRNSKNIGETTRTFEKG